MVSISDERAEDPGSIPGHGVFTHTKHSNWYKNNLLGRREVQFLIACNGLISVMLCVSAEC